MISLPLPMCWPAKEILSISFVHMGFWKWYGDSDSGQPPLPSLDNTRLSEELIECQIRSFVQVHIKAYCNDLIRIDLPAALQRSIHTLHLPGQNDSLRPARSHVSLVQPLIAPPLSRTGRRRWWKKAAGSILAKTQTPWSSIEFTSQLRRCARFLNLPSSISFLLIPKNRSTREQLSLLSSPQGLSSLAHVIGPRLLKCGMY